MQNRIIFEWPSFPLKFTQFSILPGSVKCVPAYMHRFEAAARGSYICFWSAGGKLIIVKRLWAYSYRNAPLCFLLLELLKRQGLCGVVHHSAQLSTFTDCFSIMSERWELSLLSCCSCTRNWNCTTCTDVGNDFNKRIWTVLPFVSYLWTDIKSTVLSKSIAIGQHSCYSCLTFSACLASHS